MKVNAASVRPAPDAKVYHETTASLLVGTVILGGFACGFLHPLVEQLARAPHAGPRLGALALAVPGLATALAAMFCLRDLLGRPLWGPLVTMIDSRGVWTGRRDCPRLRFSWDGLVSAARRNAHKAFDRWEFVADTGKHRVWASAAGREGGAAFEHAVNMAAGRVLFSHESQSDPDGRVPYQAASPLTRVCFSSDPRVLRVAFVVVGLMTAGATWVTIAHRSWPAAVVTAVICLVFLVLIRQRAKWKRQGLPTVAVDPDGLWKGPRDDLKLLLRWEDLVLWRKDSSSDSTSWVFETRQTRVEIDEAEVHLPSPADFVRAVELASRRKHQ